MKNTNLRPHQKRAVKNTTGIIYFPKGIGKHKTAHKPIILTDKQKEVISRMKGGYVLIQSVGSFTKGSWHLRKNNKSGYMHVIDVLKSTAQKLMRIGAVRYLRTEHKISRRHQLTALGKQLVKANTTTLRNQQENNSLTDIQKKVIKRMRECAKATKPISFNVFQVKLAVYNSISNKYNRGAGSFMKRLVDKKLIVAKYPNAHNWNMANFNNVYWELTDWGKNINLSKSKS